MVRMANPELINLAESLNQSRLTANGIESAAPTNGVYGDISTALRNTLFLILDSRDRVEQVYQSLLDGNTVVQALEWEAGAAA